MNPVQMNYDFSSTDPQVRCLLASFIHAVAVLSHFLNLNSRMEDLVVVADLSCGS
jgi:hypothetical protein